MGERGKERELERELLESRKENMQLRFEYEQATMELPRLRVRGKRREGGGEGGRREGVKEGGREWKGGRKR